jgi:uncharacterized RDD family membrane protein YckC
MQAVYYRDDDYVGVVRRLLIDAVDTTVAVLLSIALLLPLFVMRLYWPALLIVPGVWIAYFVFLKGSRFRTLGYLIAGAQIVDMQSRRPGYFTLFCRLAFAVLGPANFLLDLLWVSSDPSRQALRDKMTYTYVVRHGATPAGIAPVVYRVYTVFGWTVMCREVSLAAASSASTSSGVVANPVTSL